MEALEDALSADTAASWAERLNAAGVAAGVVDTIGGGIAMAERLGLDPVSELTGQDGRVSRQIRHPISWQPEIGMASSPPPRLGEHTESVLAWLGEGS